MAATQRKLTPKRQRFVEEYALDLNATQAAIRAGYSRRTAYSQGQRLLKDVEVARLIAEAGQQRAEQVGERAERILGDLRIVADRCMQVVPVLSKKGRKVGGCCLDAQGAIRALELLGKHRALFTDKVEATLTKWLVE